MNRFLGLALLSLLSTAACGSRQSALPIGDVLVDPARYGEQSVELQGEVSGGVGLLSVGIYTLTDSTGEINILTGDGLPAVGAQLTVRGEVLSGVTIGGTHYGVSLREEQRDYVE